MRSSRSHRLQRRPADRASAGRAGCGVSASLGLAAVSAGQVSWRAAAARCRRFSSGLSGVGLFANWELDLWGRVRAGQAFSRACSTSRRELDAEYARQSIAALVAKGWFLAIEARLQKGAGDGRCCTSAEELVRAGSDRLRVGRGDEFDVAIAQANVESLRDTERGLDASYTQALRALEALLGRYPAAALAVPPRLAHWPGDVPVGLPSELLERRPDVVAAERRVAAAFYRTEEAKAARLPRITLTVSLTTISSSLFVLEPHDNPVLSFGAGLLQPIFLGGQLQAQVEVRTAEQKQAVADYGRVGQRALSAKSRIRCPTASRSPIARRFSPARFARTPTPSNSQTCATASAPAICAVSSSSSSPFYSAQVALLRVQAERLVQRVNLHLALGGDFGVARIADKDSGQGNPRR